MKRQALLRHLRRHGCELKREGSRHSIWWNPSTGARSPIPRHNEIKDTTAREICVQIGVPPP
ncbi:MAG: type II toxin-antitoxin system HicA family toxin [Actinomycetota bacterium]|nr:type II toxin-antitoxin system HicA family toxin [Rubrobacter sp.]MDQ3509457.1 type II toxin-antitoxin system HicA family toxin [Actinomycetota bacterium]